MTAELPPGVAIETIYVVEADYTPQAAERRPAVRQEHLAHIAELRARALAVVRRERKASTSLLQRKLNLGYGRAARLIDRMEEEGIIGPDRGAGKPREVLVEAE